MKNGRSFIGQVIKGHPHIYRGIRKHLNPISRFGQPLFAHKNLIDRLLGSLSSFLPFIVFILIIKQSC